MGTIDVGANLTNANSMLGKITTLVILLISFFLNTVQAQCYYPAWSIANIPYAVNDVVSNDGKDWRCINAGQGHWEPSSGAGGFGWIEIADPCAATIPPTMGTLTVTGIYCTTAFGNGDVIDNGGESISVRGMVYNTTGTPTTSDTDLPDSKSTTGSFSTLMSDLLPNTTYYVRAYATNTNGTSYSNEVSFTTDDSGDCTDCLLACDKSRSDLVDPNPWPTVIRDTDTVCVTQDITVLTGVTVRGMLKICNGAQVTLLGAITMEGENTGWEGQVVYEGCNEKFIGTGSYDGFRTVDNSANDSAQMISYCSTCDAGVQSQFLDVRLTIAWWAATCKSGITALPVELLTFTAKNNNGNALIQWSTGAEINNDYFVVETSLDGINWFEVDKIMGGGNSDSQINYELLDKNVLAKVQYYRLRQVDFDGTSSVSNVRVVQFNGNSSPYKFLAFLNRDNQIETQIGLMGIGRVSLFDLNGKLIETQSYISSSKNGAVLKFNANGLPKGSYLLKLKSGNIQSARKLIITR